MSEVTVLTDLIGKVLTKIDQSFDEMRFTTDAGEVYRFYHSQNCCESVAIEDVIGNLDDLVGAPLVMAEEVTSNESPEGITMEYQDSFAWTFYKFATTKGYVTVRWYGESNGYYSVSVYFEKVA